MGSVFKKTTTRPVPRGAEVVERQGLRFARWRVRGKPRTAPLTTGADGADRIVTESRTYFAKYRDGAGAVRVEATGCRDEQAARAKLAEMERRAELVRSGVLTRAEGATADHRDTPLTDHIGEYVAHLDADGCSPDHTANVRRQLNRIAVECRLTRLTDLDRTALERRLTDWTKGGMGARTRNSYLTAAIAFCNWCADPAVARLAVNPFARMPKLNEKADPRHRRRAMAEGELTRLLDVARRRPLIDALTVRKGPRRGERYADVRPEVRDRLERLGRERALMYKTLILTGLRKGELTSLTVAQLYLTGPACYVELEAADEKNGEGSTVPLRDDLAADLRGWLGEQLAALQARARSGVRPVPLRLPPDTRIFDVPEKLSKILNRDLKMAEIAKRDDRGRVLDVHALRHTFGSLLSRGGVSPRTAQAAMRHSKIDLTMNVYTDPKLLDVYGALDVLPNLPLGRTAPSAEGATMTGTDASAVAPAVAPTPGRSRQPRATADHNHKSAGTKQGRGMSPEVQRLSTKRACCHSLTAGRSEWALQDLNL
jgi:integrase